MKCPSFHFRFTAAGGDTTAPASQYVPAVHLSNLPANQQGYRRNYRSIGLLLVVLQIGSQQKVPVVCMNPYRPIPSCAAAASAYAFSYSQQTSLSGPGIPSKHLPYNADDFPLLYHVSPFDKVKIAIASH